ncbi:microsomal signal peptidase subunit [Cantharellus anzutake]|uniref:microsomal signal peptidase subunit n=1 Tax=Cantharellus anzutake TaxID=1750568 RepID=UPI00190790BA|nr:microsomal signal peptidase subunit [Cantharellus anzutake]KAF8324703.1 microsomal signal peptidase subunit [Cantharellus anzutake]
MNARIQSLLQGKIDFEGQKLAERMLHVSLISSTVMSFLAGFAMQSLQVTFSTLGVATLLIALVTIPQWSMYRRHQLTWLPALELKDLTKEQ